MKLNLKELKKITNSKVFYLDFGSRQSFFWLQEFKNDVEAEELLNKVNGFLNNQTSTSQTNMLNFYQNQQSTQPKTIQGQNVGVEQVQNILQTLPKKEEKKEEKGVHLSNVLNSDRVIAALKKHPEVVKELVKHLPEWTTEDLSEIAEHIRSPQFSKTVRMIDSALKGGQLSGFMQSLGLDPNIGLLGGNNYLIDFFTLFLKI